ncbi:hypothetical protein U9M48_013936 [Paspalum notatum var. saurae]|uniref:Uncharacterized protein n=1 Tax=Paspalum notatum var. saurae TaxID=547442 RepID=A0AAQ3T0Z0_PASNO
MPRVACSALAPARAHLANTPWDHNDAQAAGGKVVFRSQFGIKVPSSRAVDLVSSPIEFGAKNMGAQLAVPSPATARRFLPEVVSSPPTLVFTLCVAVPPGKCPCSRNCIISRSPKPRTTHIFDDCIVESCGDVLMDNTATVANGLLRSCHACNKHFRPWQWHFHLSLRFWRRRILPEVVLVPAAIRGHASGLAREGSREE